MGKLYLSPPWASYYRKVKALFGDDPKVNVVYDEENGQVKLYVEGDKKAEAITALLPEFVVFGNVRLDVFVIPADKNASVKANNCCLSSDNLVQLVNDAFEGNPAFVEIKDFHTPLLPGFRAIYIVFANRVVQFFNDDLTDIHGVCSTLYQFIAPDVLKINGVNYCTALADEQVGIPLGEWP